MAIESVARRLFYRGGYPVYLARYVLFGEGEDRAALRFFNASEIEITGIRFRLTEKDGEGNILAERVIERDGLFAETGKEFPVADVTVAPDCMSVEASVEALRSGDYEYIVEGDAVRLTYGGEKREREVSFLHKPGFSARKRFRKLGFLAFVAVIAFAAIGVGIALQLRFFSRSSLQSQSSYVEERSVQ